MSIPPLRINMIFALALLSLAGCKTSEERKLAKEGTYIGLHLEVNRDGLPYNAPVSVYRQNPVLINIEKEPFLDLGYLIKTEVVDVDEHGGFAIKLIFDEQGKYRLRNVSTSFKGRRMVIMANWEERRWLAAPRINKEITDGVLVFTPDATREEADRIVRGANNAIKKLRKSWVF